jgi:acyl transferase domain-containing protein
MLAVRRAEAELRPLLPRGADLAAVNAPRLCIASGPADILAPWHEQLISEGIAASWLHTSHAFHSAMMEPVLEPFAAAVSRRPRQAPTLPIMSTVTGDWLSAAEATDPGYWARQLRGTVRFEAALAALLKTPGRVLLEVGPGQTLRTAACQTIVPVHDAVAVASLPLPQAATADDAEHAVEALGRVWLAGVETDPARRYAGENRRRIGLPGYPFARIRHWIEPAAPTATPSAAPFADDTTAAAAPSLAALVPAGDVTARLRALVAERAGIGLGEDDFDRSFIELGFDSLLLTQFASYLNQAFASALRFRQLLGDLSTPRALASYLSERMSPAAQMPEPVGPLDAAGGETAAAAAVSPAAQQERTCPV